MLSRAQVSPLESSQKNACRCKTWSPCKLCRHRWPSSYEGRRLASECPGPHMHTHSSTRAQAHARADTRTYPDTHRQPHAQSSRAHTQRGTGPSGNRRSANSPKGTWVLLGAASARQVQRRRHNQVAARLQRPREAAGQPHAVTMQCNMQHAACNEQHARCSISMQHA